MRRATTGRSGFVVVACFAWLALAVLACAPPAQPAQPTASPAATAQPAATAVGGAIPTAAPRTATPTFQPTSTAVPTATSGPAARPGPPEAGTPTPAAQPTATPTAAPPGSVARITRSSGPPVVVRIEVADTPEERTIGLMNRERLDRDAGMLFVFPEDTQGPFWMRNTLVPLSIAFISGEGVILEIQDMQPLSEELHRPSRPYRYALEVNQGFYRDNGITEGSRIEFQLGGG